MNNTLRLYAKLMRLDKPIGTLLLLWPTLWALWLAARGLPDVHILIIFVAGVILMRAAGCVINDFADRHVDGAVERTADRPLAQRAVQPKEAIFLFIVLCSIAGILVLQLNTLTILLACVAALLATIYPFMKRYTHWPQFILGLAFSWGIPMAYAAQTGHVPYIAWVLFFTAVLWTIAYDTEYAMVDREDDVQIGIKSTAILFGRHDTRIIITLLVTVLVLLSGIGWYLKLSPYYFIGVALAGVSVYRQRQLLSQRKRSEYFKAFLNNNYFGAAIFLGVMIGC